MRTPILLLFAIAILTIESRSADAQRLNYPYCAVYSFRTMSCAFNTMQQCLMTVRGVGGWCERNAWYQPPAKSKARRRVS